MAVARSSAPDMASFVCPSYIVASELAEDTLSDSLFYSPHFLRCQVLGTAVAQWGRFAKLDVTEERFKRYESLQARSCLSQSHLSFNPLANVV